MTKMSHQQGYNPYEKRDAFPLSNINPGYEEGSYPSDYPHYAEAGPAIPMDRRESGPSAFHESSDLGLHHRTQWAKDDDNKRDTAVLLESLPSKQLERMASEIAHKSSIRRKSSKRKSLHGTIHIPRGKDVSEELIRNCRDDPEFADEIEDEIKGMTMNMSQKRKVRSEASLRRKQSKTVSKWKQIKYSIGIHWKHFKYSLAEFAYFLKLWRGHLKKIEGHFGTGVLSYFLFLKWLFLINIPVFVLTFGFVTLPQILERDGYSTNKTFTGIELLTGGGWFDDTELYYGTYTSGLVRGYDMKYAYLFTCGGYYILCLIILAISISKSYKKNYIEGSGAFNFYHVTRVFCGWDYGITAKDSAVLRHKGIFNELKEYLSGKYDEETTKTFGEKCKWFFIRLTTNILILGLIGGSGYAIFIISDVLSDSESEALSDNLLKSMAVPLCVSGINLILPFIFSLITRLESYEKPKHELYISMLRTMVLKATTLGVLVYFWYHDNSISCRENFIGQQIYRLVIVDFIFILLTTFFVEFVRRVMKEHCCKSMGYPEFAIGRNTLNLIYSQALCWLGTYFAPMLSLIMIIKLFLLFYVKRISVVQNCKPSLRPWRATRAHTIFMAFLFFFFILATAAVTYAVISLKPSKDCGPFRNYNTSYSIVVKLVDDWKGDYQVLQDIVKVIASSGFIAGTLVVLLVLTYYMRIVMVGHKEMVELLRQQLSMEGRDKAYLLKMLQDANKKYKGVPRTPSGARLLSSGSEASSLSPGLSPGGRQFIKTIAETQRTTDTPPQRPRQRNKETGQGGGAAS